MEGLRLGAVRVSGELMYQLFRASRPGEWFRVDEGLPDGCEYVRSYYDDRDNCFVFVFTHESFPLTRPGEAVRFLDPPRLSSLHLTVPVDAATVTALEGLIARQSERARGATDTAHNGG